MDKLKNKNKSQAGFSLVELLVSVAILVVVSGLVFFNQSGFNNSVLIQNLAYEISLTIRQAQSYGLQSKGVDDDFEKGFGVYFNMEEPDKLILYSDVDDDFVYGSGDLLIDDLKMTNGNLLDKLCIGDLCSGGEETTLDISFLRPNPTAYINEDHDVGEIYIKSSRGEKRKIVVNKIGQISIEVVE